MAYTKYSLTPADNNAAPPNGAPEGMLPSAVNDTMRDMMSQIRDVGDGIRGGTYTMTAPVITGGSITGVALSGNTLTNPVITGGSINNTPIGASTANTGAFTTLGASGVATFSAGTVSAPAITTTGDTNTGIFFPAADTIAFTEGGVEAMRITSTGIVDIGGSSGGSVGELLVVEGANSAGHRAARINNTGTTNGYSTLWMGSSNDGLIRGGSTAGSFTDQLLLLTSGSIPISFYTANTERMRITSGGNLLIGKSADNDTTLGVRITSGIVNSAGSNDFWNSYSTTASVYRFYVTNGGTVTATNTTISAISDQRFKENIVDLDVGLDAVMALKPRKFDWKAGKGKDIKGDRGFIAQEFEQIFPDLIDEWKDPAPEGEEPYKAVRQDLIPVLVKAIQEQQTLIEQLTTRLNALEGK